MFLFYRSVFWLFLGVMALGEPLMAEEKEARTSDIFYDFSGGARLRHFQLKKASGGTILAGEENLTTTSSRLQLDFRLDKGEFFQTYFRAINTGAWGANNQERSQLTLQQAWGLWRLDEIVSVQFGRMPLEIGRGVVYGLREWQNLPISYDGISLKLDWSVMELFFHALVNEDLERVPGQSIASDPEHHQYIIDLSFKELSDIIEMADIYFSMVRSDLGQGNLSTLITPKQNIQRVGADFIIGGLYYQAATSLAFVSGTVDRGVQELEAKQFMLDSEIRMMLPDFEDLNFWAGYHYDSGDDQPGDGDDTQYDGLGYNLHDNAGRLDFFRFGNLSYVRAGFSIKTASEYSIGAEYFQFQKTEAGAPNLLVTNPMAEDFQNGVYQFGNDKDLGSEIDIWVGKKFLSDVRLEAGFNILSPGAALKSTFVTATGAAAPIDESIYNFYIDLGMFF